MLGPPWLQVSWPEVRTTTGSPTEWLRNFGHDTYAYPLWVQHQQLACECRPLPAGTAATCHSAGTAVDWRAAVRTSSLGAPLTWCVARAWLLDHMPEFDKRFLPPSITVNGTSMLDDQLAFALMADAAAGWAGSLPLSAKLAYILPYATTHESRQNWRPLFFAKYVQIVRGATTVEQAMDRLLADPNLFQWSSHFWEDSPVQPPTTAAAAAAGDAAAAGAAAPTATGAGTPDERTAPLRQWSVEWSSSTNPPVTAPLDAVAYGYSSCTGMATFVAYVARAVGIPARVAGAPCWNSGPFAGLASHNPNVSQCWHGGSARQHGSDYLYNHNWVEVYTPSAVPRSGGPWSLLNVPLPSTFTPGGGGSGCVLASRVGRRGAASTRAPLPDTSATAPRRTATRARRCEITRSSPSRGLKRLTKPRGWTRAARSSRLRSFGSRVASLPLPSCGRPPSLTPTACRCAPRCAWSIAQRPTAASQAAVAA